METSHTPRIHNGDIIHSPLGVFRVEYVPRIGPYKVFEYVIYNFETEERCFEDRIILNTHDVFRILGFTTET